MALRPQQLAETPRAETPAGEAFRVVHADAEWRKLLNADQYAVLRKSATEQP
jgi:peptide-methionine (R)-S-oxide reductase